MQPWCRGRPDSRPDRHRPVTPAGCAAHPGHGTGTAPGWRVRGGPASSGLRRSVPERSVGALTAGSGCRRLRTRRLLHEVGGQLPGHQRRGTPPTTGGRQAPAEQSPRSRGGGRAPPVRPGPEGQHLPVGQHCDRRVQRGRPLLVGLADRPARSSITDEPRTHEAI